jgi:hypothetical protein
MLGSEGELEWTINDQGLNILPPLEKPCEHAFVFKITLEE